MVSCVRSTTVKSRRSGGERTLAAMLNAAPGLALVRSTNMDSDNRPARDVIEQSAATAFAPWSCRWAAARFWLFPPAVRRVVEPSPSMIDPARCRARYGAIDRPRHRRIHLRAGARGCAFGPAASGDAASLRRRRHPGGRQELDLLGGEWSSCMRFPVSCASFTSRWVAIAPRFVRHNGCERGSLHAHGFARVRRIRPGMKGGASLYHLKNPPQAFVHLRTAARRGRSPMKILKRRHSPVRASSSGKSAPCRGAADEEGEIAMHAGTARFYWS